jgi:PadR family transcriptional regulator AphA
MSLRMGILGLLRYSPMSGYSLKKAFDMSLAYFWPVKLSQIYRELGTLEKDGCVVSDLLRQNQRPDKKLYSITERGAEAFTAWINTVPDLLEQPHRSEFMMRIFFASAMDDRRLVRMFETMIDRLESFSGLISEDKVPEFLGLFPEKAGRVPGTDRELSPEVESMYWRFTIRRFQLTAEATIRWARECIRTLEEKK